jgi:hypothetical protein
MRHHAYARFARRRRSPKPCRRSPHRRFPAAQQSPVEHQQALQEARLRPCATSCARRRRWRTARGPRRGRRARPATRERKFARAPRPPAPACPASCYRPRYGKSGLRSRRSHPPHPEQTQPRIRRRRSVRWGLRSPNRGHHSSTATAVRRCRTEDDCHPAGAPPPRGRHR